MCTASAATTTSRATTTPRSRRWTAAPATTRSRSARSTAAIACTAILTPDCIPQPILTNGFSTAAESDVRAGAGNNQVEYNINAPVSVDGGPGFDKLVILGTEFADHIVVTDKGIFGAGLQVTYQNIEVVEVDALEGDDIIDILSTQPGVATRVIGGLGNDTMNVAGDV